MNRLDLYKLASPPEMPRCTRCSHDADEHEYIVTTPGDTDEVCTVASCPCTGYSDEPPERDPDRRRDERRERDLA